MSNLNFSLFFFFLCLSLLISTTISSSSSSSSSPYLSPSIFTKSYKKMSQHLKIFTYIPNKPISFSSRQESLFYNSLLDSPFSTQNPNQAHLFFIPFSPDLSLRSLSRLIRQLRIDLPFWNSTLGSDHFFLSCPALGFSSDRNVVELKKNSIQISCFPSSNDDGKFIPHKDITLPPVLFSTGLMKEKTDRVFLGYVKYGWVKEASLVNELTEHPEFLSESEPSRREVYVERLSGSDFCLFDYHGGDISGIGEALRFGCVPVVISDRPIQDLPFMDVLRWQEIAVFVGSEKGMEGVKRVLRHVGEESLVGMRKLGVVASQHFVWNSLPQPLDSFNTMMYQLWLRRHAIRYEERGEWAQS